MKIKNQLMPIIFYNYLADPRKEGRHISWKILNRNFLFFSPLKSLGFFLNKSSKLNYKYRFAASIIGKYVYTIKKQIKLYSIFLLFFKKLSKKKYYRKNSLYYKKINHIKTNKYIFNKYKRHMFLWCKRWFKKKYKKQRRVLWKIFHKVSNNFWGSLLKKRIKNYIFYMLKKSKFKRKLFMKNYDQITKLILFFIRKKKKINKQVWKKKRKKYRLNINMPIYLKKIKYLQSKQHYQNIYPLLKNSNNIYYNDVFSILSNNILFDNSLDSLFNNNSNLYIFKNNYYYYLYFLNLKNNINNNNSSFILHFYKKIIDIYKKKHIFFKKNNSTLLIRTGLLKINKSFSSLQHGKYINIFLHWFDNYLIKNFIKSNSIISFLLKSYDFNKKLIINNNGFINKTTLPICFIYKTTKNNLFYLENKTNLKNLSKFFFLKNKKIKKLRIKKNNKSWYRLKKFYKYKRHKNKKYFFYPYGIKVKFLKKFRKFKKLKKIKKNKFFLNKKFKTYYIRKIKKMNIKKLIKKYYKKKKLIKKIFNYKKTKKLFFYKKLKSNFFSKYDFLKKQKLHFLKKYKRRYRRKLNFGKKLKQNKFSYKKKNKKKNLVDFIRFNDKKQRLLNRYKKFSKNMKKLFKKYLIKKYFYIKNKKKIIKVSKNILNMDNTLSTESDLFLYKKSIYKNNFYFCSLNKSVVLKELIIHCIINLKDKKFNSDRRYLSNLRNKINKLDVYNLNNILEFQINYKYNMLKLFDFFIMSNIKINSINNKNVYSKSLYNYYNWVINEFVKSFYFKFLNNNNINNTYLYKNYIIN